MRESITRGRDIYARYMYTRARAGKSKAVLAISDLFSAESNIERVDRRRIFTFERGMESSRIAELLARVRGARGHIARKRERETRARPGLRSRVRAH